MKFRIVNNGDCHKALEAKYKGKWSPCCMGGRLLSELCHSLSAQSSRIMFNTYYLLKRYDGTDLEPSAANYKAEILKFFEKAKTEWIEDRKVVEAEYEKYEKAEKLKKKLNKIVIDI